MLHFQSRVLSFRERQVGSPELELRLILNFFLWENLRGHLELDALENISVIEKP